MGKKSNKIFSLLYVWCTALLIMLPLAFFSCIDEDLSECGSECEITFQLQLELSLQLAIEQQLASPEEQAIASILNHDLQDVICNTARNLDLSFYERSSGELSKHSTLQTNTNEIKTTLYLQPGSYNLIAVAKTSNDASLAIHDSGSFTTFNIRHDGQDTVSTQTSAIYTGILQMDLEVLVSRQFYMPLYMENSIAILVIDPQDSQAKVINTYTTGVAYGKNCADSMLLFNDSYTINNTRCEAANRIAYYAVCFPTHTESTRFETNGADNPENSIWQMTVITQTPDGKYVKNTLHIQEAIHAGEVKIIKVVMTDDGRVQSNTNGVGVSVELNWKPGGEFDIEI